MSLGVMASERLRVWISSGEKHDVIVEKTSTLTQISEVIEKLGLPAARQSFVIVPAELVDVIKDPWLHEVKIEELDKAWKLEKIKVALMREWRQTPTARP